MQTPSAKVRPPAVAGSFYPADAGELRAAVETYLEEGEEHRALRPPKAVIAPHAGFVYSGPIAGSAFRGIEQIAGVIDRVVIIGPAHHVPLAGLALPDAEFLETPLECVPVDLELARALEDLPQVSIDADAHAAEHSLEVELPFLQVILGDFKVLPLVVGEAEPHEVAAVLERVWGDMETVIVVSSDLSHYLRYDDAQCADRTTCKRISSFDATLAPENACGAAAINGLLELGRKIGLSAELLDLRNSGDTAGDRDAVVGYAAFSFRETG